MGGTVIDADTREAASALRWWIESGVDVAIQESPRNWLDSGTAPAPTVEEPKPADAPAIPDTLEAFQQWLSTSPDAPLSSSRSKPVLPSGVPGAEVMIIAEPPTRDELASGQPVGGEAAQLMQRMLAAIGMADSAYAANLACFHSPGGRMSPQEAEQCASAARRHVALVKPKRLLLLGEAPCRAIIGKPLAQARGHVHSVEGVRTIATFHPRHLLNRSDHKSLAWKDLLLLAEDSR